ncbi:mitogen-activated protein kinase kinase kinase 13-A-like isoform X2 [Plodia interpunctella]|uniref:mitogen-activated protein kinase kinase kinase 13-A-like isoform X2 n=1 Tax=Plodia interpunctella TaxID=58824 RepID=UPI002368411F|nr:mitogen-activated protein kinase kinase kinase 13-A-like isoform X2 [Plodia interpunctella]
MAESENAAADNTLDLLLEESTLKLPKPSCLSGLTNVMADYYNFYVQPLIDFDFSYKEEWEVPYDALSEMEYVGAGAFGKVYSAKLRGEVVAVKIPEDKRETDMIYLRELRHENIVRFRGVSTKGPKYCIVMEFCQYGSLYNFLHSARVNIGRTLQWAKQIATALAYLHARNIIHRDLKSPNVLIADNLVCKVSDFGTSRKWEKFSLVMTTRGTTYWMAPELMLGKKCSDKVDVWSYGVVLWELLTQEVPYEDLHPCAVTYGVGREKLSLPVPSTFPMHLKVLIQHCWNRQPKCRPSFTRITEVLTVAIDQYGWLRDDLFTTMQDSWRQEVQLVKKNGWQAAPPPEPVVDEPPKQNNFLHKKIMREATKMYMDACALYLRLEQRERAIAEREKANNMASFKSRLDRRQRSSSTSSGLTAAQLTVVKLQQSVNHKVRTVTRLANMASLPDDVTTQRRRSRSTPRSETKTNDLNGHFNKQIPINTELAITCNDNANDVDKYIEPVAV